MMINMLIKTFTLKSFEHSILSSLMNKLILLESDTSVNELVLNNNISVNSSYKCLTSWSEKHHLNSDLKRYLKKKSVKADHSFDRSAYDS